MKNSKKILVVAMSMIMIIATIIPTFAITGNAVSFLAIPNDIGTNVNSISTYTDKYEKYYIVIHISNANTTNYYFDLNYKDNNNTTQTITDYIFIGNRSNGVINYGLNSTNINMSIYSICLTPYFSYYYGNDYTTLYIPIYCRNVDLSINEYIYDDLTIYLYGSTSDDNVIANEAFDLGYNIGYNTGYNNGIIDSAGYQQDLNLVEHCEQLIGTFVGDDYAHYITPLCLALVVILVYFLFIRWLLALVKSKNVTRVADIIVCTACIIMLVIMYAPMLDLTIHQAQTVYQITADTVVGG